MRENVNHATLLAVRLLSCYHDTITLTLMSTSVLLTVLFTRPLISILQPKWTLTSKSHCGLIIWLRAGERRFGFAPADCYRSPLL
ncbi:hypothetical protein BDZ89DRAFT_320147 [Hymenopellis radicata]|nr:hypothetical protein BDZ89DRAFT_320147 [Hymenopellis radicata]